MTQLVRPRITAMILAVAMIAASVAGGALIGRVGLADAVVDSGDKSVTVNIDLIRIRDTRNEFGGPLGGPGAKLGTKATETIQVAGTNGIPSDAKAICINLTVLNATTDTFVSVFGNALPAGQTPKTSTVNPGPGSTSVNGVIVPLDATGKMRIFNNAGTVDFFIDVSCYTSDHNHDDRYYTETEADARYQPSTNTLTRYRAHLLDLEPQGTTNWVFNTFFLSHGASGVDECITAPVHAPIGVDVSGIEIRYSTGAAATIDGAVYGLNSYTGPLDLTEMVAIHHINNDAPVPSSGGAVGVATIAHNPADVTPPVTRKKTAEGDQLIVRLCTSEAMTLHSVDVIYS